MERAVDKKLGQIFFLSIYKYFSNILFQQKRKHVGDFFFFGVFFIQSQHQLWTCQHHVQLKLFIKKYFIVNLFYYSGIRALLCQIPNFNHAVFSNSSFSALEILSPDALPFKVGMITFMTFAKSCWLLTPAFAGLLREYRLLLSASNPPPKFQEEDMTVKF